MWDSGYNRLVCGAGRAFNRNVPPLFSSNASVEVSFTEQRTECHPASPLSDSPRARLWVRRVYVDLAAMCKSCARSPAPRSDHFRIFFAWQIGYNHSLQVCLLCSQIDGRMEIKGYFLPRNPACLVVLAYVTVSPNAPCRVPRLYAPRGNGR